MRRLVITNNVNRTIFMHSKMRYAFYDPIKKRVGVFKFCPPHMMCVKNNGRLLLDVVGYHD